MGWPVASRGPGACLRWYAARFLEWAAAVSQRGLDLTGELAGVTQPAIAGHGRYDRARPPEQGRELASSLPNAEFRLLETGHSRRVTGGGPSDTNECEPNRCPAVCWRTAVTTVRIVFARHHLRPARAPDGSDVPDWRLHQQLIVLADTVPTKVGGHRAVPLWLVPGHKELLSRLSRPAADTNVASGLLEAAVRLLRTAGTEVSAVDIEPASDDVPELRWDTVTARVGLATATGTRPVTVSAESGWARPAVAGAPVRVPDTVMDRLAVAVPGEDMLAPFRSFRDPLDRS